MTRHYFVHPDGAVDPRIWREGEEIKQNDPLPSGDYGFPVRHNPEVGLYIATEDSTLPGVYERWLDPRYTLVFSPDDDPANSRVLEAARIEKLTLDEVYDRKRRDIGAYDQEVRYNAVDTSLSVNWWLVATQDARFELNGQINSQGWPSGPNAPWVGIFNAATIRLDRVQITDSAVWDTLYLELTQHDQACGNATDASQDALSVSYGDGSGAPGGPEWQAVALHDPADPAWGYPPTVSLEPTTPP